MLDTVSIERRPATDGDEEFLYEVYAGTRDVEMALVDWDDAQKADFLRMQFRAQHSFYHAQFPDAAYDVLMEGERPIGRLYLDRRVDEIRVLDIALLAEHRNKGIGTALIRAIMDEASSRCLPVTLNVEVFNPARQLYERLGFVPVQNDGIYLLLKWNSTQ